MFDTKIGDLVQIFDVYASWGWAERNKNFIGTVIDIDWKSVDPRVTVYLPDLDGDDKHYECRLIDCNVINARGS